MKFVAFILAFLVLALSVLPCADTTHPEKNAKAKTEIATSDNHPDNSHEDNCSPFCHCTCCATFAVNHFIASLGNYSSYTGKAVPAYLPAAIIEIALPVWQPPQLV